LAQLRDIDICVPIEATLMPTTAMVYDLPTIKSFGQKVLVMSSLQKPRRISVLGSDGSQYMFLCKSNDDLRKDARMMEFNVMINTFLRKDRDARERSLYIRTYAVTPLGDLWGLIEWVNHTKPLKAIVQRQWESMGRDIGKIAQLTKRELDANNMKSVQERIWAFENKVLPECPAVLHRWFLQMFREPSQWLAARTQFARTLATMSIVGYILGLGDRHAENILLHEKTGDVVHVDVNMLFDRGQKLPVPEVVPFRLTQNLLDAMGPSGYEGTYRMSCEIVLRVLQQNKSSLLSVFETLVHDPIVEWKRYGERQTIQARAKRQLDAIERKINATGNTIEDEVSRLILEATSNSNLATMFIGVYKLMILG
jgi:phosphatidylinositol kinase/protein kinase (PI-3  family)